MVAHYNGVLWHTADIAVTRPSVNEVKRRYLLELAMATGGRECFGALRLEYRHVEFSIGSVGGAYWSW